ncbi:E3 ubiquitin-protein ligase TRIM47-like [Anoplopoma fimbria]|uniref:E3 ubiquitin-protein ligase TRIM47-like n=1 Tax=Anoplopoma fimbria TaxID=229290 RepID=UPI0023EB8701|nr:E3 ubiquitin-protein ligase TRIM47-like [Anoplopoma fimbria]
MAFAVMLEEQFKCCICLDKFTNPTTITCGHTFCLDCIEGFWDMKRKPECPLCKKTYRKRPKLSINLGYAEIIEFYKRSQGENLPPGSRKDSLPQLLEADEVPCDICCGDKSPSVKSCLTCLESYCEFHLAPHLREAALQTHQLTDSDSFIASHLCRKHKKPLTMFCKSDQKPVCVKCTEREHKRHYLVPIEEERKRVKTSLGDKKTSIKQMFHARCRKWCR